MSCVSGSKGVLGISFKRLLSLESKTFIWKLQCFQKETEHFEKSLVDRVEKIHTIYVFSKCSVLPGQSIVYTVYSIYYWLNINETNIINRKVVNHQKHTYPWSADDGHDQQGEQKKNLHNSKWLESFLKKYWSSLVNPNTVTNRLRSDLSLIYTFYSA